MTMQTAKPEGFPWISPYLIVQDVQKAVDFYQKAFGFRVKDVAPGEDGIAMHAELTYKDQVIMIGRENGCSGSTSKSPASSGVEAPISLYIYTENVDDFFQQAVANQARELGKPEDMFWGDRMCRLQDPDQYLWCFATKK